MRNRCLGSSMAALHFVRVSRTKLTGEPPPGGADGLDRQVPLPRARAEPAQSSVLARRQPRHSPGLSKGRLLGPAGSCVTVPEPAVEDAASWEYRRVIRTPRSSGRDRPMCTVAQAMVLAVFVASVITSDWHSLRQRASGGSDICGLRGLQAWPLRIRACTTSPVSARVARIGW